MVEWMREVPFTTLGFGIGGYTRPFVISSFEKERTKMFALLPSFNSVRWGTPVRILRRRLARITSVCNGNPVQDNSVVKE
jgi:hypothetical protein